MQEQVDTKPTQNTLKVSFEEVFPYVLECLLLFSFFLCAVASKGQESVED